MVALSDGRTFAHLVHTQTCTHTHGERATDHSGNSNYEKMRMNSMQCVKAEQFARLRRIKERKTLEHIRLE